MTGFRTARRSLRLTARAAVAALFALTLAAAPAAAQSDGLPTGIWALHGLDEDLPTDDLEPLVRILRRAEVVGLGEAVHGTAGFSRAKARLFRYMVEELGFRAFGFETSWRSADSVARYVETCKGSLGKALNGLFPVWQNVTVKELIVWMCHWNRDHPDDPLHFYGFDHQQSFVDSFELRRFLIAIGFGESDPRHGVIQNCSFATAPSRESLDACLELFDELLAYFEAHEAEIVELTSELELEYARLHIVGLAAHQQALFYYERGDWEIGFEIRDEAMAVIARTLRRLRFPEARTALWAHNAHIAKGEYIDGSVSMGGFLKRAFRKRYKAVALVAYEGEIDWVGVGCGPYATAEPGSVEARLRELGPEYLLVDLRFRGTRNPFLPKGRRYPMDWDHPGLVPRRNFDGLVYMEKAERMEPLAWPPCG